LYSTKLQKFLNSPPAKSYGCAWILACLKDRKKNEREIIYEFVLMKNGVI